VRLRLFTAPPKWTRRGMSRRHLYRRVRKPCSSDRPGDSHELAVGNCLSETLRLGKPRVLVANNRQEWHVSVLDGGHDIFGCLSAAASSGNCDKHIQIGVSVIEAMRMMCTAFCKFPKEACRRIGDR
jgi:hypothetical protein